MNKANQTIYFNLERNSFYKINKQTGQSFHTYKNGDRIKTFKPNVTGMDYLLRRKRSKQSADNSLTKNNQHSLSKFTNSISKNNDKRKALDSSTSSFQKLSKGSSSELKRSYENLQKTSIKFDDKKDKKSSIVKQMLLKQENKQSSSQQSPSKVKKSFLQTITKYSQVIHDRTSQNNSPKRDSIRGGERTSYPSDILCKTIKNFKEVQPIWGQDKKKKSHKKRATIDHIPDQYQINYQSNVQKRLFYRAHPQYVKKQSPKKLDQTIQRKKNMKMLQKLFIRQNDHSTKMIYK